MFERCHGVGTDPIEEFHAAVWIEKAHIPIFTGRSHPNGYLLAIRSDAETRHLSIDD